ncbi:MAG: hypothetical protein ACLR23_05875 [Clostridia bacterium]
MREGDELNTPKSEEVEMDWLMKEFDELHRRSRNQEKASALETPLPAGLPDEASSPGAKESAGGATAQLSGQRPVYNVLILPADTRKITLQDLEHMVPLEITDETAVPAWLAELRPAKAAGLEIAPDHTNATPVQKGESSPFP